MKNNFTLISDLPKETEQVLVGSLLGDGCLRLQKGAINAFYREQHSLKEKEYLVWKNQYLSYFNTRISEGASFDNRTNKSYPYILLWSKSSPLLTDLYNRIYINGRKKLTIDLLNKLGPLGLAIWYCDDGHYQYGNNRCGLATQSFDLEEHNLIRQWFKNKWDIEITIEKRKSGNYSIRFNRDEADKFLSMIKKHVPQQMVYKLGHHHSLNKQRVKAKMAENAEKKREYRQNNLEKVRASSRRSHLKYCEKLRKKAKERYWKNLEKMRLDARGRYHKHKEKIRIQQRIYREENREKIKEQQKEYYERNKDLIRKKARMNYWSNPEHYRQKARDWRLKQKQLKVNK